MESVATKREASDKPLPSSPSLPPPATGNGSTILVAPINESPVPSYFQLPPDLERPRVNHPELSQSNHSHSRRRPSSSHDGHPNERSPLMGRRTSSAMRDAYFDVYMHHHDHAHSEGHCPEIDEGRKDKAIQLLGVCVRQLSSSPSPGRRAVILRLLTGPGTSTWYHDTLFCNRNDLGGYLRSSFW